MQHEICLTPITRRQNKRGRDDGDETWFNQFMLMITNQQMNEIRERVADREEQQEERRLRFEEQREDRMMQFQMQQQLMATMMMMVGGRNMEQPVVNVLRTNIPNIRPMQNSNENIDGNNAEHVDDGQERKEEE